ncbi:MAG: hypothetical protein K9J12_10055, partial [Melioribacteraceae bacterium]|nr:hypothetical protein [Melioribacteraceae bacterium]
MKQKSNFPRMWTWMIILILSAISIPLQAQSGINEFGSFEQDSPSYWSKGSEPAGATLTWAYDESVSLGRSLKIEKAATSEAAVWQSDNMCDIWSPIHNKDVDLK